MHHIPRCALPSSRILCAPIRAAMLLLHRLFFLKLVYGSPISQAFQKRSTNESGGLTSGETAGLVMGIIGVLLTAVTIFKGWECWKSRRRVSDGPFIMSHIIICLRMSFCRIIRTRRSPKVPCIRQSQSIIITTPRCRQIYVLMS